MGLFQKKKISCFCCRNTIDSFKERIIVEDGVYICVSCYIKSIAALKFKRKVSFFQDRLSLDDLYEGYTFYNELNTKFKPTQEASRISIDETNYLIKILNHKNQIENFIELKKVVDYDITEDNISITKGGLGGAIVGATLLGTTGAIIGSNTKKSTTNEISSLKLVIYLDDLEVPKVEVSYITNPISKNNYEYPLIVDKLERDKALIKRVCEKNKKTDIPLEFEDIEKIKKLKELLDMGILTQEEFDLKKKQILGL